MLRSVSVTAGGPVPVALPVRISLEQLRTGLLWLTGVSGAFVFIEPSPYEYASLLAIVIFAATGLALRAGIMPLALLLGTIRHHKGWAPLELDAVRRFSTLGIASVAILIVSGVINAWILVGSFRGLIVNGYGLLNQ